MSFKRQYKDLIAALESAYADGQQTARHGGKRASYYCLCEHGRWRDAACLAGYDDAISELQRQSAVMRRLEQPTTPLPPPPRCNSTAPRLAPPSNVPGAQCTLIAGHDDWHSDGTQPNPMRWTP